MCNVPPKFNQICRLCLTLVEPKGASSDDIVKKLSIFKNVESQQGSHKNRFDKKSNQIVNDDDDQLNKKAKRSNEISISLSGGGSASVINNGYSSNDIEDDSDIDISKRILQCLSINVSHLFSYLTFTSFDEIQWTHGQDVCGFSNGKSPQNILALHF